eukprot:403057-Prorocentrum_minimum.AAC.1
MTGSDQARRGKGGKGPLTRGTPAPAPAPPGPDPRISPPPASPPAPPPAPCWTPPTRGSPTGGAPPSLVADPEEDAFEGVRVSLGGRARDGFVSRSRLDPLLDPPGGASEARFEGRRAPSDAADLDRSWHAPSDRPTSV